MFRNIVVGLSGGVDSAVAAHLLKEKGFNVMGVFMRNWDEFDEIGHCSSEHDIRDAEYASKKLGIELRQVNYVKDYWNSIFTKFLEDYENGLTPNPDILCNKHIKFDLFHKYAIERLGYDAIATGHYARSSFGTFFEQYQENEEPLLLLPKDNFKDQTFFLSGVRRQALRRSMFPLADLYKSEVKDIARKCGLERLANKKESTGICFVGNRNFKQFIEQYIYSKLGNFIDIDTGEIVGSHEGIHQWTLGQRCRLHSCLQPYYIASKDPQSNIIYVAAGHENPALYSDRIETAEVNWLCSNPLKFCNMICCRFRFQHTKPLTICNVYRSQKHEHGVTVVSKQPMRALTPGQYVVFYTKTECLGSARILSSDNTLTIQPKVKNELNL